jgi:hypothetical protein
MKQLQIFTTLFLFIFSGVFSCLSAQQPEKSAAENSANKGDVNMALGRKCKVFSFTDSSDMSFRKLTDGTIAAMAWSSRAFATVADHILYPEYVVIDLGKTCAISFCDVKA